MTILAPTRAPLPSCLRATRIAPGSQRSLGGCDSSCNRTRAVLPRRPRSRRLGRRAASLASHIGALVRAVLPHERSTTLTKPWMALLDLADARTRRDVLIEAVRDAIARASAGGPVGLVCDACVALGERGIRLDAETSRPVIAALAHMRRPRGAGRRGASPTNRLRGRRTDRRRRRRRRDRRFRMGREHERQRCRRPALSSPRQRFAPSSESGPPRRSPRWPTRQVKICRGARPCHRNMRAASLASFGLAARRRLPP